MNSAGLFPMNLNESVTVLSVKYYMGTSGIFYKSQNNLLILANRGNLCYKISGNTITQNCNRAVIIFSPANDIIVSASDNCIYTVTEFNCAENFFPKNRVNYSVIPVTPSTRDVFNLYGSYSNLNISEYSSKIKQNLSTFFDNAAVHIKKDACVLNHYKIEPNLIKKAKEYIDDHFTENINVLDVAKAVCLSDGYMSKCFTNIFGISPKKYILQKRIKKAQVLLKTTRLTSREIAHSVGFSSPQRFNCAFVNLVGTPPLTYRKNNV